MSGRVFLSGAHLVLPDRIETGQTLVIEGGRIADIVAGPREVGDGETRVHLPDCFILPGFVDVHVHGIAGHDVLDGPVRRRRRRGPAAASRRHRVLSDVHRVRTARRSDIFSSAVGDARRTVNPDERARARRSSREQLHQSRPSPAHSRSTACAYPAAALAGDPANGGVFRRRRFSRLIDRHCADIAILTLAPELDGGLALDRARRARSRHSRVARPFRRDVRAGPGGDSRPARVTRRICSIACRR